MADDSPEIPRINPRVLAGALAKKPHFRSSLLRLLEDDGFQVSLVRRCVQTFRQVFARDGEAVVLKPKLALCPMNSIGMRCRFGRNCRSLHICPKYLTDECDKERCPRGHNWDVKPNSILVYKLFLNQLHDSDLKKLLASLQKYYEVKGTSGLRRRPSLVNGDEDRSSQINNLGDPESLESPTDEGLVSSTVWSHYVEGEIQIPEICNDSVVGKCPDEENGCPRLHASLPYHWQTRKPEGTWYNLQATQVEFLELNYCDPSKESCIIPKLDPTVYGESERELLVLLGLARWKANFEEMNLSLSTEDDVLMLRRVCVEPLDGVEQTANVFVWYYETNTWLPYDSEEEAHPSNSVTSEEIENAFHNNKHSSFYFTTEKYTYTLDFKAMTQINDTTDYTRRVRRRPKPHLQRDQLLE